MIQRSKSLLFANWEYFRAWYTSIKKRFQQLTLKYVKFSTGNSNIRVIITY